MEIDIVKEKETPLLSRKRVTAWAKYEGSTPSRVDTLKEFSKKINIKPEKIVIKHMYTRFGQQDVKIIANVYDDIDTLKRLEPKELIEKHKAVWDQKKTEGGEKKKEGPATDSKESASGEGPASESASESESSEDSKESASGESPVAESASESESPEDSKESASGESPVAESASESESPDADEGKEEDTKTKKTEETTSNGE